MSELSAQRGATSEDLIKRREFRERLFHWEDSNKQRPACVSVHMCDSLLPLCSGKKKGTSSYVTVQTSVSLWSRLRATVSVRICSVRAIHNNISVSMCRPLTSSEAHARFSIEKLSGWRWLEPTSVLCSEKLDTPPPLDRTIRVSPDMPPNSKANVP